MKNNPPIPMETQIQLPLTLKEATSLFEIICMAESGLLCIISNIEKSDMPQTEQAKKNLKDFQLVIKKIANLKHKLDMQVRFDKVMNKN